MRVSFYWPSLARTNYLRPFIDMNGLKLMLVWGGCFETDVTKISQKCVTSCIYFLSQIKF